MSRSLHTDEEIALLLDEAAGGVPIVAICASAGISVGTFYRWRRRLGGLKPAGVARLDRVEQENVALRAEVQRLRAAMTVQPWRGEAARPGISPRTASRQRPHYRGGETCIGRFAFVRTAT
ncbi:transposase [Methylobacterium sp. C33D]|uniref:transposase n=1 Tax=Methylobacterium mesophilicum TaxID=39956 RepID=UPI002F2DF572